MRGWRAQLHADGLQVDLANICDVTQAWNTVFFIGETRGFIEPFIHHRCSRPTKRKYLPFYLHNASVIPGDRSCSEGINPFFFPSLAPPPPSPALGEGLPPGPPTASSTADTHRLQLQGGTSSCAWPAAMLATGDALPPPCAKPKPPMAFHLQKTHIISQGFFSFLVAALWLHQREAGKGLLVWSWRTGFIPSALMEESVGRLCLALFSISHKTVNFSRQTAVFHQDRYVWIRLPMLGQAWGLGWGGQLL